MYTENLVVLPLWYVCLDSPCLSVVLVKCLCLARPSSAPINSLAMERDEITRCGLARDCIWIRQVLNLLTWCFCVSSAVKPLIRMNECHFIYASQVYNSCSVCKTLHLTPAVDFQAVHLLLESNWRSEKVHLTELCKWNSREGLVPMKPSNKLGSLLPRSFFYLLLIIFLLLRTCWWLQPLPSCGWYHPLPGLKAWQMWSGPPVLHWSYHFLKFAEMSKTCAARVLCLTWVD